MNSTVNQTPETIRAMEINASTLSVALPEDHDPTKPFPLTIKRDFENPNCWATGNGGKIFRDKEWAEKSMEMDTPEYRERSRLRMEHSRLVKAEVVDWSDWVYSDDVSGYNDGYFESVDALREHCESDDTPIPAYCFSTKEQPFAFDIFDALENYLNDEHHEEANDQIKGWDELSKFWDEWSKKQTLKSYFVDFSKVVVIDRPAFEALRAQANAFLAAQDSTP